MLHLVLEMLHVAGGDHMGMGVGFDGVVFRRQAKGVKAHGEQHVVALHATLAGDDFKPGIGLDVAHMHPRAGGIGEFHQTVELGFGMGGLGLEGVGIVPMPLPLLFNVGRGVDGNVLHVMHLVHL